jgi:ankyrin repeat protein
MLAAVANSVDIVSILCRLYDADPNLREAKGNTAVHLSAATGNFAMVSLLVQYGADASIKNDEGKTADTLLSYSKTSTPGTTLEKQGLVASAVKEGHNVLKRSRLLKLS